MLHVHGIGHAHPPGEISNAFLEDLDIGTTNTWILERTGIRTRRTVLDRDYIRATRNQDTREAASASTHTNAELGNFAAELALARAGLDKTDIGMVIGGGSMPNYASPAEGCIVAAELGIDVPAFDLRSACTSFGAQLHFTSLLDRETVPEFLLLVQMESCTTTVDYRDRRSAVLWGDGAAAAVVSRTAPGFATISDSRIESRPSAYQKVTVPWAGHFDQEGQTVQSFAIKTSTRVFRSLERARSGERPYFVGHQANLLMLENVCRVCDVPDDRHLSNVAHFGNTASVGAPSVLSENWDRFAKGDRVAVVGVGAGLTWAGAWMNFSRATALSEAVSIPKEASVG